ncbi:hypothetical protein ACEWF6_00910 [Bifidobacterium catenulatum subsp. kashiwanohense]|uniref:hypothetical protein n=1 Tax=Bifidobacterium catenulatum TaxID=1686 RepID=UPI003D067F7C
MMLTNLYTEPLKHVILSPGWNAMDKCSGLTIGQDYYVRFYAMVSGGTAKLSGGGIDMTLASSNSVIVGRYVPVAASTLFINVTVVNGSPKVEIADFTVCAGYADTKRELDSLRITRFNGDTMPLA